MIGPADFGPGGTTIASTSAGDVVGLAPDEIVVPGGYISGSAISDSMTFDNTTIGALGLDAGTYVYTFGTGPDADSFTVQVDTTPITTGNGSGSSVPLPASAWSGLLALLGMVVFTQRGHLGSAVRA